MDIMILALETVCMHVWGWGSSSIKGALGQDNYEFLIFVFICSVLCESGTKYIK